MRHHLYSFRTFYQPDHNGLLFWPTWSLFSFICRPNSLHRMAMSYFGELARIQFMMCQVKYSANSVFVSWFCAFTLQIFPGLSFGRWDSEIPWGCTKIGKPLGGWMLCVWQAGVGWAWFGTGKFQALLWVQATGEWCGHGSPWVGVWSLLSALFLVEIWGREGEGSSSSKAIRDMGRHWWPKPGSSNNIRSW